MDYQKFTALTPKLYEYCLDMACHQSQALHTIYEHNANHPQIRMQISNDQAQFLQFLIGSHGIKHILEIGTFLGFSAAAMAEALPENGRLITLDCDERVVLTATQNWKLAKLEHKIELRIGKALESLADLEQSTQRFDLIFIDADKGNYIPYFKAAQKLLSAKGIIAVDNIFYHGEVCEEHPSKGGQHMQQFNQWVKQESNMDICLLPIADGLLLARNP